MNNFSELINGEQPVLVDFYATWCGPCKAMAPELESAARELEGSVKVLKVDIDKNRPAAEKFSIQGVPTLILFQKGEIVWRKSGAMGSKELISEIQPFLT